MMQPEVDMSQCTASLTEPHMWVLRILEVVLAVLAIISNCILTVATHNAVPIPFSQRKMLASVSLNFVLLSGYQFARNLFLGTSMYRPCVTMVTTISCKLHEFPLLFCYIHGAAAICIVAIQTTTQMKTNHRPLRWTSTCSVWQSALVVVCIAATLVFTAFDHDIEPENMSQCSILMALRDRDLAFCLLSLLILLHAVATIVVTVSARRRASKKSTATYVTISLKDVITVETAMWHCSFLFSGSFVLYRHVVANSCDECILVALELSFIILPLTVAFLHPMLIIWFVFPMRDAAVKVYPCLRLILPEYAMVPPTPVHLRHSEESNAAVVDAALRNEQRYSLKVSIPQPREDEAEITLLTRKE